MKQLQKAGVFSAQTWVFWYADYFLRLFFICLVTCFDNMVMWGTLFFFPLKQLWKWQRFIYLCQN